MDGHLVLARVVHGDLYEGAAHPLAGLDVLAGALARVLPGGMVSGVMVSWCNSAVEWCNIGMV